MIRPHITRAHSIRAHSTQCRTFGTTRPLPAPVTVYDLPPQEAP